jgi:CMP-N-acetylneuraminic acid synthetase
MSASVIALLPIKAHSSRIPNKNFRSFCGKPLYRWILDSLLELNEIDKVLINTDAHDKLIETGLPQSERVQLRSRRAEICGDTVSMNTILADDIANEHADIFLMTHATNPLLKPNTIRGALDTFRNLKFQGRADSLFTVNRLQSRFYKADCSPINHDPSTLIPTQDLEPWYEENSNLYIFTKDSFMNTASRIGLFPSLYVTPPLESIDIDTPDDWDFALSAANFLQTLM